MSLEGVRKKTSSIDGKIWSFKSPLSTWDLQIKFLIHLNDEKIDLHRFNVSSTMQIKKHSKLH